jgi:hypothetical protein
MSDFKRALLDFGCRMGIGRRGFEEIVSGKSA